MQILAIYPHNFAAYHAAKDDTFAVPDVKIRHVTVRSEDEAYALSGMQFDAVIGLDHCHADFKDYIKARVRSTR